MEAWLDVRPVVMQGGDAVWEGLRVYDGRVMKLDEHLGRLLDSAKAMHFQGGSVRRKGGGYAEVMRYLIGADMSRPAQYWVVRLGLLSGKRRLGYTVMRHVARLLKR
jgi:hypothetical protein